MQPESWNHWRPMPFPDLGRLPVAELTAPLLLDALRKIERRGAEPQSRVLQRVGSVMRYAIQTGRCSFQPFTSSTV